MAERELTSTAIALIEEAFHGRPPERTQQLLFNLSAADEPEAILYLSGLLTECLRASGDPWVVGNYDGTTTWLLAALIGALIGAHRDQREDLARLALEQLTDNGWHHEAIVSIVWNVAAMLRQRPNGAKVLQAWLIGGFEIDEEKRA